MKSLRSTALLAILIGFFASGCIYVEHNPDDVIIHTGDLEVRVTTPSGFVIEGAEITLYQTYDDALEYRYRIGHGYTDRYGITTFHDLPAGDSYYVRAQGSAAFSLGSVFIEHEGLWIIEMELI